MRGFVSIHIQIESIGGICSTFHQLCGIMQPQGEAHTVTESDNSKRNCPDCSTEFHTYIQYNGYNQVELYRHYCTNTWCGGFFWSYTLDGPLTKVPKRVRRSLFDEFQ